MVDPLSNLASFYRDTGVEIGVDYGVIRPTQVQGVDQCARCRARIIRWYLSPGFSSLWWLGRRWLITPPIKTCGRGMVLCSMFGEGDLTRLLTSTTIKSLCSAAHFSLCTRHTKDTAMQLCWKTNLRVFRKRRKKRSSIECRLCSGVQTIYVLKCDISEMIASIKRVRKKQ